MKKEATRVVEASSKSSEAGAKSPNSLKPRSKITKRSSNSKLTLAREAKFSQQVLDEPEDEKRKGQKTDNETSTSNIGIDDKKPKPQERLKKKKFLNQKSAMTTGTEIGPEVETISDHENKSRQDADRETHTSNQRNDGKKSNSQERNKGKSMAKGDNRNKQRDHRKEKLGGLIMMCNGKTKPDCFRYRVMGVPMKKKEIVMSIRPGLKLFLYDFDLKLLYGIYTASSSGGMKLEPNAFDGAFPVQVQFKVHQDCYPLHEDVFKKVIKGYSEKNRRFDTELTFQQVKKLEDLFRPVPQQETNVCSFIQAAPAALLVHPPLLPILPVRETSETPGKEPRYYVADQERERFSRHREITSVRNETLSSDPLFLSEKDYRTYGLGRSQHATVSPVGIHSSDSYKIDNRGEQLHNHPTSIHRDNLPRQIEEHSSDPLFLSEKDYRTYGLGRELPVSTLPVPVPSRSAALELYSNDPSYTYRYGSASSDSYSLLPATSSELYSPLMAKSQLPPYLNRGTPDHLLKRERDEKETLHSTYASTGFSDPNRTQHLGRNADQTYGSVSLKYVFPGPSVSYH